MEGVDTEVGVGGAGDDKDGMRSVQGPGIRVDPRLGCVQARSVRLHLQPNVQLCGRAA